MHGSCRFASSEDVQLGHMWLVDGLYWTLAYNPYHASSFLSGRVKSWGQATDGALSLQSEVTGLLLLSNSQHGGGISHFQCRQSTWDTAMLAINLYECYCWCYSSPTASISKPVLLFLFVFSLVLLENKNPTQFYCVCVHIFLLQCVKNENSIFCGIPLNPYFVPYTLCHPLFLTFSPPSPWIPQPHHNTVNRPALTDLLPSSFHWPLAWQPRFNAVFSLAKTWQINLWVHCDLMPTAFEVSYSSVAYRTQKRCQVAIVKSYPWREVALAYNSPYIMRAEETLLWTQRENREMWNRCKNAVKKCTTKFMKM